MGEAITRKATVADVPVLTAMHKMLLEETVHRITGEEGTEEERDAFFLATTGRLFDRDYFYIVAERDGGVVAYISGLLYRADCSAKIIGLCDAVYVTMDYRGEKIADQLINELSWELEKAGAQALEFETLFHPKMEKRWESKGFKPLKIKFRKELL